jgi:hypothetical protein
LRAVFASALLLASAAALVTAGCDDPLGLGEPVLARDTVFMGTPTSTSTRPTAIDLADNNAPRRPELPVHAELWDFQLRQTGNTLFLASNPGRDTQRPAGIATASRDIEQLEEAPTSRDDYQETPIALAVGTTFVAHSRDVGSFSCVKYAKLKVLALDPAAGEASLVVVSNQGCGDDRLTGGEEA